MATRIDRRFAELKTEGRAALVTFLTAGDPDPETSLALVQALPAGVYVAMNGRAFEWNDVRKNRETGTFETSNV